MQNSDSEAFVPRGSATLVRYEVLGNGKCPHITALQSVLIDHSNDLKYQGDTLIDTLADKTIALLTDHLALTQEKQAKSVKDQFHP